MYAHPSGGGSPAERRRLRRRLVLFWSLLTLAALGAVVLVLSLTGLFSNADQRLSRELEVQLQATGTRLQRELDQLTARSLKLSETVTAELEHQLMTDGLPFQGLNDSPEQLLRLQQALYAPVLSTLQSSNCSGAYVILDVTANRAVEGAETSRSGLYLRSVNLTGASPVDPDITFFRGIPEVARQRHMELHNRWDLEFDTSLVPGYAHLMDRQLSRPADHYYWTDRVALGQTWEEGLLLCVPLVGQSRQIYGVCGVDVSALYFSLSCPVLETAHGPVTTVLAPLEDGRLMLKKGLIGAVSGAYLDQPENLTVHQGRSFYTYLGPADSPSEGYVGLQKTVDISLEEEEHRQWVVALLMPAESYRAYTGASRTRLVLGCAALLLVLLAVSLLLYRRFLQPFGQLLPDVRQDRDDLEELLDYARSRGPGELFDREGPPPDISAVLDRFTARAARLSGDSGALLALLAQGCSAEELADRRGESPRRVSWELDRLCDDLCVGSVDDLLLYLDFLRHSGRLDRLL